jgi:type II secretory pathway component PulJ
MEQLTAVRRREGFTMMELMIALLIAFIVVLAIGKLMVVNQTSFGQGREKAQLQQNATEVLDRIARSVRGARTLDLVGPDEFRTYDAAGSLAHTYRRIQEGGLPGILQQDGRPLTSQECTIFACSMNDDETMLTLDLELRDAVGNIVNRTTRITVRNRTLEF